MSDALLPSYRADIDKWSDGIVTRGILLDVPRFRGTQCVTMEAPVHDQELTAIARAQGVEVLPGDALVVFSGRTAWDATHSPWGGDHSRDSSGEPVESRPGLHASCVRFIRDTDASVLVWDMMDMKPNEYGLRFTVHSVLSQFGVALVDNALLEPVAEACRQEERYEFALLLAPLRVAGGTGSPINPIAMF
jgi:kynurenine formamidase